MEWQGPLSGILPGDLGVIDLHMKNSDSSIWQTFHLIPLISRKLGEPEGAGSEPAAESWSHRPEDLDWYSYSTVTWAASSGERSALPVMGKTRSSEWMDVLLWASVWKYREFQRSILAWNWTLTFWIEIVFVYSSNWRILITSQEWWGKSWSAGVLVQVMGEERPLLNTF